MDMLNSGSVQDAAKAGNELRETYADLMDIDGSALSASFVENAENLELMRQATEGVDGAYDKLMEKMREDIVAHCDIDTTKFDEASARLTAELDKLNFKKLEIGAELNSQPALNAMSDLVNAANMTKEQAEAYLASMGIDAEIEEQEVNDTEEEEITGFHPEITNVPSQPYTYQYPTGSDGGVGETTMTMEAPQVKNIPDTQKISKKKQAKGFTLKVTSATKSSGGNFKFNHTTHGAGSQGAGKTPSGGSGGSGGSKSPTPKKKTVKEHKEQKKEEDRYHDLKERIDDVNTALNRMGKTKDRVYGKAKLKYMDQELARMKDQIALTKEYIKEAENYLKVDRAALEGIKKGAAFDENGMLTNYEEVLQNITKTYNNQLAQYNAAVDRFNASAQEDSDNAAFEAEEKALAKAEKTFNENKKILKQYEDTYNLIQKQQEELIDQLNEYYDTLLENVDIKVQMKIDLEEDDKKLLE
jgi:predicted transcriptional regulator